MASRVAGPRPPARSTPAGPAARPGPPEQPPARPYQPRAADTGAFRPAPRDARLARPPSKIAPSDERITALGAQFGDDALRRLQTWKRLTSADVGPGAREEERVARLHEFLALLPYVTDLEQWGTKERWATPIELLTSNGGDCEDFAIARYFSLRELGVPPERIQVAYVHLRRPASPQVEPHMVLLYWAPQAAEPLVLDNYNPEPLPGSARPDLTPVYAFNEERLWVAAKGAARPTFPKAPVATPARLSRWQDLVDRMNAGR